MIKKRKMIISIVVMLVLILAMTITAYAACETCSLYPSNSGEVHTSSLDTSTPHLHAYNYSYSTDWMDARIQVKTNGQWTKLVNAKLNANGYWDTKSGAIRLTSSLLCRTKIYSVNGNGGVRGNGDIFDN